MPRKSSRITRKCYLQGIQRLFPDAFSTAMTRLLLSVRDAEEARIALSAGVPLIDIKEPTRGSLGPADSTVVEEVLQTVAGRSPVSMALGELRDWNRWGQTPLPAGIGYAKLGLAGCAGLRRWPEDWRWALATLASGVASVAVVYADWLGADAPRPWEILRHAVSVGCRVLLVDTFDKTAGSLLDYWPLEDLAVFTTSVRQSGLMTVLAGSLSAQGISRVLCLEPDYVAVRGAACQGGRSARLDPERIRQLLQLIAPPSVHRAHQIA